MADASDPQQRRGLCVDPSEETGCRDREFRNFLQNFFSKDDILLRVRYKEIDSGCGMPPCILLPLGGRAACLWKICNLFFYSHRAGRPLARAMSYLKERHMKIRTAALAALCGGVFLLSGVTAQAETVKTPVHRIDAAGMHDELGTIIFADSPDGLVIDVNLAGLPAGPHGMHIHEKGDCGPAPATKGGQPMAGYAAGGHYDPDNTGSHKGPQSVGGHKGDLPLLVVPTGGKVVTKLKAPQLKVSDIKGRAVVIHSGGDNYADAPKPLGGGGDRIACGVIPAPK